MHTPVQANILQPLTHVGTLSLRYEAVEELLASEEMHVDIAQALQSLPRDLEKVCRGLVSTPAARSHWLVVEPCCGFHLLGTSYLQLQASLHPLRIRHSPVHLHLTCMRDWSCIGASMP